MSIMKELFTKILAGYKELSALNEMAISRNEWISHGISQSKTVLKHIGKICVFENDFKYEHLIVHWENEIAAQIYDIAKIDISKDNKSGKIKKKAFIRSFIDARLGKDFSEYEDKMPSYFIDALEDEGLTKDQIKRIDVHSIVEMNKDRIRKYLLSFIDLLTISDFDELKEQCRLYARRF